MKRSATVISRGKGRDKTWWARLVYTDEATGKRRDRQRRAESYADAKEKAEQLAKEFDESQGRSIDAERRWCRLFYGRKKTERFNHFSGEIRPR